MLLEFPILAGSKINQLNLIQKLVKLVITYIQNFNS